MDSLRGSWEDGDRRGIAWAVAVALAAFAGGDENGEVGSAAVVVVA